MTTHSPPCCSDNFSPYNCDSNNGEDSFPIEKYSKYTGAVTKQYIHPNSPEHVSLNNEHRFEFESQNDLMSELEFLSHSSSSETLILRSRRNKNISNEYSSACSSNSDDDRHHSSRKRTRSTCKEKLSARRCRQKNIDSAISEEDSCWEKESEVHSVSNTLMKDTSTCQKKAIRVRSKVDNNMTKNKNKTEVQNRERKTSILKTDVMVKLVSSRDKNAHNKYVRKSNRKESDTVKKKVSKLTNKRTGESGSAITRYFQKKDTKLISPCSSSEQSVRKSELAITDVSGSDDYVPGTPIHTTRFGIQVKSKIENSSVKNTSSSGEEGFKCLKPLNSSVRIQRTESESTDCDTDKSKSKNIPECSAKIEMTSKYTKKEKRSKLSARRNEQKSLMKVSTESGTGIPSYFRPVAETTEDATSGTANENNCQLKHSPRHPINVPTKPTRESLERSDRLCRMSSLQRIYQQELNTTVGATNEGEVHNENLCSSSREEFGKRIGDSSLHSANRKELKTVPSVSLKNNGDSETDLKQEILTSSNNDKQDFTVLHLTLKQLEQRFRKNVRYIHDIMKGKKYCWRQEQFEKGGVYSDKLLYAVATVPYTIEQLDHLLLLLRGTFFRKQSFVTHYDYIMKVLLPEAATKIYMDEFSLSHDEALSKIHNIYIISGTVVDRSLHWLLSDED